MRTKTACVVLGFLTAIGFAATEQKTCNESLSENLSDESFTASSVQDTNRGPSEAKMTNRGWIAARYYDNEFLQLDFERKVELTLLRIWPINSGYYTKSVRLSYSNDKLVWKAYNTRLSVDLLGEVFNRNSRENNFEIVLDPPIQARYLALNPTSFYGYPSMKVEVFGCNMTDVSNPFMGIIIERNIEADVVWIPSRSPVVIDGPIVVSPAATITVQAGVSVVFTKPGSGLTIYGGLNTKGIFDLGVLFTSNYPVVATKEKWDGIKQASLGTINLLHTAVRQSSTGILGNGSHALIDTCLVYSCTEGIKLSNGFDVETVNTSVINVSQSVLKHTRVIFNGVGLVVHGINSKELFVAFRCIFANSTRGVHLYNWNRVNQQSVNTVFIAVDSEISDNSDSGVYISDGTSAAFYLKRSILSRNRNYGVYAYSWYNYNTNYSLIIENCTITDHSNGIYVRFTSSNGASFMIQNNYFLGSNIDIYHSLPTTSKQTTNVFIGNNYFTQVNKVPLELSLNSANAIYIHSNNFTNTKNAIKLTHNGVSEDVSVAISYNTFKDIFGQYALLTDGERSRLVFMSNRIQNVSVEDIINIKSGHIGAIGNNFTSNRLTRCNVRVENDFTPKDRLVFNKNYWGSSNIAEIRSKICDFFLDSSKQRVEINSIYSTSEMTNLQDTSHYDNFVTKFDTAKNMYIVGGIITEDIQVEGSVLRYPIIVDRSIIIEENVTVSLTGVHVKFKESRGIINYGYLHIGKANDTQTTFETFEVGKFWNGLVLYKQDLLITNTHLEGSRLLIDSRSEINLEIYNSTINNTKSLFLNRALNGKGSIYIRYSIIKGGDSLLTLKVNDSDLINVTVENSYMESKGNVILLDKTSTQNKLNELYLNISSSNLSSGQSTIVISNCYSYLIASFTDLLVKTTSRVFDVRVYATDLLLSNSTFSDHRQALRIQLCTKPREERNDSRNIAIIGCMFGSASWGSDIQFDTGYTYALSHDYSIINNTFSDLANYRRYGVYISEARYNNYPSGIIERNSFKGYTNAINIVSSVDQLRIQNNTCIEGNAFVKTDFRGRTFKELMIINNFVSNNTNNGIVHLLQPYTGNETIVLTDNIFANNLGVVVMFTSPYIVIRHNFFENSQSLYNLKVEQSNAKYQSVNVNASLNYWGTDDVSKIARTIFDQDYDSAFFDIVFRPYLGSKNVSDIQDNDASFISESGDIGGKVNGDVTLTLDGSPYRVVNNIEIHTSDYLHIEAGVKLLFDPDLRIIVKGVLNVSGTVDHPVSMVAQSKLRWNGVEISANSSSSLRNLIVNSTKEGVKIKSSLTSVYNLTSTFSLKTGIDFSILYPLETDEHLVYEGLRASNNTNTGISFDFTDTNRNNISITLKQCEAGGNRGNGVSVRANASVVLSNCQIIQNTNYGVYVAQSKGGKTYIQRSQIALNNYMAIYVEKTRGFCLDSSLIHNHFRRNYWRSSSYIYFNDNGYEKEVIFVNFTNNTFENNTSDGILMTLRTSTDIVVQDNTFTGGRRVFYCRLVNGASGNVNIKFTRNTVSKNSELERSLITIDFRYSFGQFSFLNNSAINNTLQNLIELNGNDYKIVPVVNINRNIFRQNRVLKNLFNILIYPKLDITHNLFMNHGSYCELMPPSFINASFYINATHNYWATWRVDEVVEKVCGFDTNIKQSFVYYMPYYMDASLRSLVSISHDSFNVEGAVGGEITKDTVLSEIINQDDVTIGRSILIRNGSRLIVRQGTTLKFHPGRGIYAEGSLQLLGGDKNVHLTSKDNEGWHGVILNTKSGISIIDGALIQNSENGILVLSNLTSITKTIIQNTSANCLTMDVVFDNILDLQSSRFFNCSKAGLEKRNSGNLSVVNMIITNSRQGVVDLSKDGNIMLRSSRFHSISSAAVTIRRTDNYWRGNIVLKDCEITNSSIGVSVDIRSLFVSDRITIDGNKFTNITGRAISVSYISYTYNYNDDSTKIVSIGQNTFNSTCGVNFISSNFVNLSFHGNTIINSACNVVGKDFNFLTIDINNRIKIPYRMFDISSNIFFNISCSHLARLWADDIKDHNLNGTIQYNRFVDIKAKGILLMDTHHFHISDNIFDSPESLFDLYVIKKGNEVINASHNWWGKADIQYALSRIYDNRSNPDVLGVNLVPILTEQSQDCSGVNNCSYNGECISKNRCRCYSGWKGKTCTDFNCDGVRDCYGNGVCIGPNQCQCLNGWSGDLCILPSCRDVGNCNGYGICVQPNICVCASRFTGSNCSACVEEHWGPYCQPCPYCVHGTCNLNTGKCLCNGLNWAGELCDKCNETFYGDDCLPLMTVLSILPSEGLDRGGNFVHVWGHNFPESKTTQYKCKFGEIVVDGIWLARNHVTCTAPQHNEGGVTLEISSDGVLFTDNKVMYRFYASCPRGSCGTNLSPPHGYCLFGACSCILPWTGENCDIELLPPIIKIPPSQQVAESTSYTYTLTLTQGEEPIRWMLVTHPNEMIINERTGKLEWNYAYANTAPYIVKVTASNVVGEDSAELTIDVPISYSARIDQITPNGNLPKPTPIRIVGSVQFINSSQPKIVPVDVIITNAKGTAITLPVLTSPLSPTDFEIIYYPRPDDSGEYFATARHPALKTDGGTVHSWKVEGIQVYPSHINWNGIIEGDIILFQNISTIVNTGGLPVQNITVKVDGLYGAYVRKHGDVLHDELFLGNLDEDASLTFDLVVENPHPLSGVIYVVFNSAMGLTTRLRVNINLSVRKPLLVMDPSSISEDIVRGSQKIINVKVSNIGEIPARNVKASLPKDQKFSIISFSLITSNSSEIEKNTLIIPAKGHALLVLAVTIPPSDGLGEMNGHIAINTNLTTSYIRYKVYVTSKRVLSLNVTVTDEYTYYASDRPYVSGAKVVLTNPRRNYHQIHYTGNITGTVQFENIKEDRYSLYVEAEEHSTFSAVIIASSDNTKIEAFLKRTAVKIDWSVEQTTVTDEYVLKLESTFETFVPMPVVTIEPGKVNTIPFELGEEDTIEFTITNHGLVRADNVRLVLPTSHPYLTFHTTIDSIGNLEANSTIVVPVKTKSKTRVKRNFIANVVCGLAMLYDLLCGGLQTYMRDITLTREYPGRPPLPCGLSDPGRDRGGGDPYNGGVRNTTSGPGGGGGGTVVVYTPTTPLSCDCLKSLIKTCIISLNGVAGCTSSITDVMTAYTDENSDGDLILGTLNLISGLADSAFACVFGKMCGWCGDLYTAARCWTDIELKCDESRRRRDIETDVVYNLVHSAGPLDNFLGIMKDVFGDERMYNLDTSWYGTFKATVADESDNGALLSFGEMESILQALSKADDKNTLTQFLHRWNNTAAAWNNGSLLELASTGRVIDVQSMEPKIEEYILNVKAAKRRNYSSIFDEFDNAYAAYQSAEQNDKKSGESDRSVCAKVRIRIVQNLVLTRSAFNAKLEMENGENSDLEDIKVEILIRRSYGSVTMDNDKFSIGSPKLVGITAVDGTGSLKHDMSGTAEWLIIPYTSAAPREDTLYDIGGILSYRVGSSEFSVPLLPDTLTVKSNPSLVVHYFHEKYVRGDDPLTAEIEPTVPFSLCVMVMNAGYGNAKALKLSSAQPEIIENEKGLLVSFKIIGVRLGNNAIAPSLTVNFGDIESFQTKTAQWLLTSTLKGTFYNYSATFENINPLGDPELSLLEKLEYHELIHLVSIENLDNDITDYLVNDIVDENGVPDYVFNSGNGSDVSRVYAANVTDIESRSFQRAKSKTYLVIRLNVSVENITGWFYVRVENNITSPLPRDNQHLLQVFRHDGKKLLTNTNAWQTTHIKDKFLIHIFDKNDELNVTVNTNHIQYDLTYGPRNVYAPKFNTSDLEKNIPSDTKIGQVIMVIHAYDIDMDELKFSMTDPAFTDFTISESGEVFLNRSLLSETSYRSTFQITVEDNGIPMKSSVTTILVNIGPSSTNLPLSSPVTSKSTFSSTLSTTSAVTSFSSSTGTNTAANTETTLTTGSSTRSSSILPNLSTSSTITQHSPTNQVTNTTPSSTMTTETTTSRTSHGSSSTSVSTTNFTKLNSTTSSSLPISSPVTYFTSKTTLSTLPGSTKTDSTSSDDYSSTRSIQTTETNVNGTEDRLSSWILPTSIGVGVFIVIVIFIGAYVWLHRMARTGGSGL